MNYYSRLDAFFPVCRSLLGKEFFNEIIQGQADSLVAENIPELLREARVKNKLPGYIPDLALFELKHYKISVSNVEVPAFTKKYELNPTLVLLCLSWEITPWLKGEKDKIEEKDNWMLIWRGKSGETEYKEAAKDELLAVKATVEEYQLDATAEKTAIHPGKIQSIMKSAAEKGILTGPPPKIKRKFNPYSENANLITDNCDHVASSFSLDWNITTQKDGKENNTTLEEALRILDTMSAFCINKNVLGHISFSGENPFANSEFMEIYSETVKRGFSLSIAAKPISTEKLEKIASIRKPEYFELKLEGLKSHSDSLLGKGNFSKTVSFLDTLNNKKIKSAVMLTLTKSNINQVLPLAEFLKDKTDCFSFARPASTGLGPVYDAPEREKYKNFIDSYITASMNNPIMGYKENLINIELKKRGMEPYGGCSGFGCGAAFCFLALFPGGDVHACGKINSPLGNIKESTILEIYSSEEARQYRIGPEECASCALRKYCGGCSAVATAFGFDCSKKHDPYCFIAE